MSDFKFNCPFCGQMLEGEREWVGEPTECPLCHKWFNIPEDSSGPRTAIPVGGGVTSENDPPPPTYRRSTPPPASREPPQPAPSTYRAAADDAYILYNPYWVIVWAVFIPQLAFWFLKRNYEELDDLVKFANTRRWFRIGIAIPIIGIISGVLYFLFMNANPRFTALLNVLIVLSRIGGFGIWVGAIIESCRFAKAVKRDYGDSAIRFRNTRLAGLIAVLLVVLWLAASISVVLAYHCDFAAFAKILIFRKNVQMTFGVYEDAKSIETLQKLGEAAQRYCIVHHSSAMPDLQTLVKEGYYVAPADSAAEPHDPADDIRNYFSVRNIRLDGTLPDEMPVMFYPLREGKGAKWTTVSRGYGRMSYAVPVASGGWMYVLTMGNIRRHTPPRLEQTDSRGLSRSSEDMAPWAVFPHHMDSAGGIGCCANLLKLHGDLKNYAASRDASLLKNSSHLRCPETGKQYVLLDAASRISATGWGNESAYPVAYCPSPHKERSNAGKRRLLVLRSDGMVVPIDNAVVGD